MISVDDSSSGAVVQRAVSDTAVSAETTAAEQRDDSVIRAFISTQSTEHACDRLMDLPTDKYTQNG